MLISPKRLAVTGILSLLTLSAAPSLAHAMPDPGWQINYMSPDFPGDGLSDIAATGPDDAWSVGTPPCCTADYRRLSHWDGTQWQDVTPPTPPPATETPYLSIVRASSPTDVWTFGGGYQGPAFAAFGGHWDGTDWRTTEFEAGIQIHDAVVLGAADAWFVGTKDTETGSDPIAEHYDGTRWTTMALPGTANAISAVSANDIWAVGESGGQAVGAMHWDGRSWRTVKLPKPALGSGVFMSPGDVLAVGPHDVWASAVLGKEEGVWPGPVLWHWNGKRWALVRINAPKDAVEQLASDGAGGLWIVSSNVSPSAALLHYSHGRITREAAPVGSAEYAQIRSVALIPGTRSVWGVGTLDTESSWAAAVFRYDPAG
jgi:hypothetical protein